MIECDLHRTENMSFWKEDAHSWFCITCSVIEDADIITQLCKLPSQPFLTDTGIYWAIVFSRCLAVLPM